MLALATTIVVAAYLIVPELLFRFTIGLFIPLRDVVRSRTQELGRSFVLIVIPTVVGLVTMRHVSFLRSAQPGDYRLAFSCVANDQVFAGNHDVFYSAVGRIGFEQGWFLALLFALVIVEALLAVYLTKYHGRHRHVNPKGIRAGVAWMVEHIFTPNVSEWHLLLTSFVLPHRHGIVWADVLATNGILYQGQLAQYYTGEHSNLTGILLQQPRRFDREGLQRDRENNSSKPLTEYWHTIPSNTFYIFADKIVNINVRHELPQSSAVPSEAILRYLNNTASRPLPSNITVTVDFKTSSKPTDPTVSEPPQEASK